MLRITVASVFLAVFAMQCAARANSTVADLEALERQIAADFASVSHIEPDDLLRRLRSGALPPGDVVFFDVREAAEHKVSSIEGAARISPDMWGWMFIRRFGETLRGKTVVFFCSVGVRSSRMVRATQAALKQIYGVKAIHSLRGGAFAWHNSLQPLTTPYVHPFDQNWARYIERQSLIRYWPEEPDSQQ